MYNYMYNFASRANLLTNFNLHFLRWRFPPSPSEVAINRIYDLRSGALSGRTARKVAPSYPIAMFSKTPPETGSFGGGDSPFNSISAKIIKIALST